MKRTLLLLLLLLIGPVVVSATTVSLTGTITVNNNPVNGTLTLQLPVPAIDTSTNQAIAPSPFTFRLINGAVQAGATLTPTDVMQPQNVWYTAQVRDTAGALLYTAIYVVPSVPSTFNIGLAIPTVVTTSNVSYLSPFNLIGNNVATGQNSITAYSISGVTFVDGNKYATVAAAVAAVAAAGGGIVNAQGCNTVPCLALGTIDAGNGSPPPGVVIYLGPFHYTATKIVLRAGFKVFGAAGAISGSGTFITATSTTLPLIVGPQAGTDQAAQRAGLEDIFFQGANGGVNTSDGMFLDTTGIGAGGLGGVWYSAFRNLSFTNFGGIPIHLRGAFAAGQGLNQWLSFYDVVAFRTLGGGNALKVEGNNFQVFFNGGELDSVYGNANLDPAATPNVYIGCAACSVFAAEPYIIHFIGTTIQGAANLVQVDGANDVLFEHTHHEQSFIAFTISTPSVTYSNESIHVRDASFNGNVGINAGNGALMSVTSPQSMNITMEDSHWFSPSSAPDSYMKLGGSTVQRCCKLLNMGTSSGASNWPSTMVTNIINGVTTIDLTAQQASIGFTNWYTPQAPGFYQINAYEKVTQAATTSSSLTFNYGWKDGTDGTAQSFSSVAVTGNTTATLNLLTNSIYAGAGTAITYGTTYASVGGTVMQYELHIRLISMDNP